METIYRNAMEKDLHQTAKRRVRKIKRFYIHLMVFVIANSLFLLKTYFGLPFNFWPIYKLNFVIICVWSFVLIIQALNIFVKEVVLGKKWEANKVREMLEKKSEKQNWE